MEMCIKIMCNGYAYTSIFGYEGEKIRDHHFEVLGWNSMLLNLLDTSLCGYEGEKI